MYDFKENSKRNVAIAACFIVLLSIGLAYFLCRRTNVSDIRDTVERAEQYNQQTRDEIGNASDEIESAANELNGAVTGIDRSIKSITEVKESTGRSTEELRECERLIREGKADNQRAGEVLDAVRKSGKGPGT